MAHLLEAKNDEEKNMMDIEETPDAKFASISHSRALISPNDQEFELISQRLNMLMTEGRGECIFEVGLGTDPPPCTEDDQSTAEDAEDASGLNQPDYEASVATLRSITESLNGDCVLLRERVLSGGASGPEIPPDAKRTGQYLIRKRADDKVDSVATLILS